jgi:hypothetical protein
LSPAGICCGLTSSICGAGEAPHAVNATSTRSSHSGLPSRERRLLDRSWDFLRLALRSLAACSHTDSCRRTLPNESARASPSEFVAVGEEVRPRGRRPTPQRSRNARQAPFHSAQAGTRRRRFGSGTLVTRRVGWMAVRPGCEPRSSLFGAELLSTSGSLRSVSTGAVGLRSAAWPDRRSGCRIVVCFGCSRSAPRHQ